MNIHQEISFLNSLLEEDEPMGESPGPCPEPTILWSFTQKEHANSEMVGDLSRHVARCRACADLTKRFQAFHDAITEEEAVPAKSQTAWKEAEPQLNTWVRGYLKSQAAVRPHRRFVWSLPSLSWGIVFAAGAAAIVLAVKIAGSHEAGIQPQAPNQIASAPGRDINRPSTAPNQPGDQPVLMNGQKPRSDSGHDEPQTLTIPAGEHLQLTVTTLDARPGGGYTFDGKLIPVTQRGAIFDAASVSGTWIQDSSRAHLSLSVREAVSGASSYRTPETAENPRIEALTLDGPSTVPQVGQTILIEIVRGPVLEKIEP
jgi:hypothetical protein